MFSNEITASGKIRWDYEKHNVDVQMFPCNLPPLKICKFAVRELDYIYTKTGKQLDKGIGLEKNTTNWH